MIGFFVSMLCQLPVTKANKTRMVVKEYQRWLIHQQFACLRQCFEEFNVAGEAVINVNGKKNHFARSTILALDEDHP